MPLWSPGVGLSAPLTRLHSEYDVRDTLLHVTHALVGPGHAHDAVWQAKTREVGSECARTTCSNGARHARAEVLTCHGRPVSMHPNYLAELCALQTGEPVRLWDGGCGSGSSFRASSTVGSARS